MSSVGDSFAEKERRDFAKRSLVPKNILYLSCPFTTPPKEKFTIVAAAGERPLLILINTRINQFIQRHPHLRRCQVKLLASDYNIFQVDSFAHCADIKDDFSEQEIIDQIMGDTLRVRGKLLPLLVEAAAFYRVGIDCVKTSSRNKSL